MPTAQDLSDAMETIAPTAHAESWDNVGLLVGKPSQPVSRLLLCIDYTAAVAAEAKSIGADAVIAYHPVIFKPIKRLNGGLVFDALANGIAIYSPHTALDVAPGGTNDMLADVIGMEHRAPLRPAPSSPRYTKLVTFVPEAQIDAVADALFAAGAGKIGNYGSCSFRAAGTGTFLGDETTHPTIGQPGKLERVAEVRLETILHNRDIAVVVAALHEAHPYEEPAFDLIPLTTPPANLGMGWIGAISTPSLNDLLDRIKRGLGVDQLLIARAAQSRNLKRAAVCAGSCGDMIEDALASGADVYLTGEMRHHDALRAAEAGMTVIAALHSNSERAVLPRLAERLRKLLPTVTISVSREDRDPFTIA